MLGVPSPALHTPVFVQCQSFLLAHWKTLITRSIRRFFFIIKSGFGKKLVLNLLQRFLWLCRAERWILAKVFFKALSVFESAHCSLSLHISSHILQFISMMLLCCRDGIYYRWLVFGFNYIQYSEIKLRRSFFLAVFSNFWRGPLKLYYPGFLVTSHDPFCPFPDRQESKSFA